MEKVKRLINDVHHILQEEKIKKEESLRRGERFNMFQVCGVDHYEIMHSAIIASFLNPKGNHGQKDKYLKTFISIVDDETGIETSSCSVYTEYVTNEGRIDILIEDKKGKAIIIENKVYAADQWEQLKRYDEFSKGKYGDGNYAIYYLTLNKHYASKDSGDGIKYIRISYKEHILKWIEDCTMGSATTPLIRETLIQYRNHIKQLTNQDMDTINKEALIDTMIKNPEEIAALFSMQEDYKRRAFDKFVKPAFEDFCKEDNLIYGECNLFEYGAEKGFYFRREKWDIFAIWVHSENKRSNSGFYWGISDYNGDVTKFKLDNSSYYIGGKSNAHWPYGYAYLEKYGNWDDMNTVAAMIKGDFAKYIIEIVRNTIKNIDEKQLSIP